MPGIVAERVAEQVTAPVKRNNQPGEWLSDSGEVVPLTAAQSARLAELFATYNARLVNYATSRLTRYGRSYREAQTLAEDIAQSVWMQVARNGRKILLSDESLDDGAVTGLLFVRIKYEISAHFRRPSETAIDMTDAETCSTLCPLLAEGCAVVALPDYLARMVAALPDTERQALLLKLDGLHPGLVAEHMQCSSTAATRLATAAVLLLQIDNPELCGPATALESLAAWEQEELAKVSAVKREALLRLDSQTRQAILLKAQGVNVREIAKRLEMPHDRAASAGRCASSIRPAIPVKAPVRLAGTSKRTSPKTDQVTTVLREEIARMEPGARLAGYRELKERFGVGGSTIDRVRAVLCDEGLIELSGIRGYRVADTGARLAVAA